MAKKPAAIEERVTPNSRVSKTRDTLTKSIKGNKMRLAVIKNLNMLLNGKSSN